MRRSHTGKRNAVCNHSDRRLVRYKILLQIADPPRDVPVAVRTEVIIPSTKNTERCDEIVRIVKKIITDKTHFDYISLFDMDKLTQYPH
jgi:hypothetical protein